MAVRTKRLAAGSVGNATVTVYTAPAGETSIIKTIGVYNGNAAAQSPGWSLRVSGSSTDYWFWNSSIPSGGTLRLDTWLVLQPGDSIRVTGTAATVFFSVHGTELEGVAD